MYAHTVDFGGVGPGIVLLHGLMGDGASWASTASWLRPYGHVVAPDARGHGASDKPDGPYDRDACVRDVVAVIEAYGLAPAVLIGHSMGGLTAWQVAGRYPDLVRAVVIGDMEARPPDSAEAYASWFASWPVPFPDGAAVRAFFGRDGAFFEGIMVPGEGGLVPPFSFDHLTEMRSHWNGRDLMASLAAVACLALVVRAEHGDVSEAHAREMVAALPLGSYACVPNAGHVLHYDNPAGWRRAVEPFVLDAVRD